MHAGIDFSNISLFFLCKLKVALFLPCIMDHLNMLKQIAMGDRQAFRALYEQFRSRVYNTVLLHLQDSQEAEEVTQDVFLEIFQSAARFEGKSSPGTWIYRIAVNKSVDRLRYKSRKKRSSFLQSLFHRDSGEIRFNPPDFDHPGVVFENKENARLLFKAIENLPEQQKTAFLLAQVEGLPQKEVAGIMDLSVKAVESLLQRSKTNLRATLEKYYPERQRKTKDKSSK
jgi:RNA polymerase sigma-70 factor (ECF subfamily)